MVNMIKALIVVIAVVCLFGTAQSAEKLTDVPIGDSPSWGPVDAPVTIIEFIDFQ